MVKQIFVIETKEGFNDDALLECLQGFINSLNPSANIYLLSEGHFFSNEELEAIMKDSQSNLNNVLKPLSKAIRDKVVERIVYDD